jgi:hypothetical protein
MSAELIDADGKGNPPKALVEIKRDPGAPDARFPVVDSASGRVATEGVTLFNQQHAHAQAGGRERCTEATGAGAYDDKVKVQDGHGAS